MLSINYVHVVLFIVSVSSGNFLQNDKCVYFESESGFIKLLDAPSLKENSTISMEVKAYNCDAISIRLNNGENYNLIVSDPVLRKSFEIFSSCIGLWQEVRVELRKPQPLLKFGSQRTFTHTPWYELDELLQAFDDHALYLGVYPHNEKDYDTRRNKTFKGFMRNIKIDDQVKAIDSLDGTLSIKDCPKDFQFGVNGGSVLVSDDFHVNDDILIYFELKIAETNDCNALIMSAYLDDSYWIVEIVNNVLYMKMSAGSKSEKAGLYSHTDVPLCDGKWHKIALRKAADYVLITSDTTSYGSYNLVSLNFTSPLYVGQHPDMQEILAIQSPNSLNGCLRGLHINGVATEVTGNFLFGDSQLGICST